MNLHRSREAVPSTPRANYLIIKTEKFFTPIEGKKKKHHQQKWEKKRNMLLQHALLFCYPTLNNLSEKKTSIEVDIKLFVNVLYFQCFQKNFYLFCLLNPSGQETTQNWYEFHFICLQRKNKLELCNTLLLSHAKQHSSDLLGDGPPALSHYDCKFVLETEHPTFWRKTWNDCGVFFNLFPFVKNRFWPNRYTKECQEWFHHVKLKCDLLL